MVDTSTITNIAAFGASNLDNGNLYSLTSQVLYAPLPNPDLGYQQAHTNGDVYIEYTADLLGIAGLDNYAVSGAQAMGSYTVARYLYENGAFGLLSLKFDPDIMGYDINLEAQVDRFIADNEGVDLDTTMAVLHIGLNDFFNYRTFTMNPQFQMYEMYTLMLAVSGNVLQAAEEMLEAGVGTVVINTLGSPGGMPVGLEMGEGPLELYNWVIEKNNIKLRQGAEELQAQGYDVVIVDVETLTEAVADDLSAFGFVAPLDTYTVYYDAELGFYTAETGYDDDQVAFYDHVHATTAYHGVAGVFEAKSLTSDVALFDGDEDVAFTGTDADDLVMTGGGADVIALLGGDDVAITGHGDDQIDGGDGKDLLNGGSGNDIIDGGLGADVLAGSDGDDILRGGEGQDVLIGGLGSDIMEGGAGDDQFLFRQESLIGGDGTSTNQIDGGEGYDVLYLAIDDATRAEFDGPGQGNGIDTSALVSALGLELTSIEEIVVVDSRADLAAIESEALLHEADLWGMI